MRLYRNAFGAEALVSDASEPVPLGTAVVAAVAAGIHGDLFEALGAMGPRQEAIPADSTWAWAHESAY